MYINFEGDAILVELSPTRGEQNVALNPQQIAEKSAAALNSAMSAIYSMSRRIFSTIQQIPITDRPDTVEVEFALKLTTEANAFIVNAGTESQITVTLKWANKVKTQKSE